MPAAEPYIDTSALAKRYLNEPGSEALDAFLGTLSRALISRLTVVELRCLLRRRWRAGEIDDDYERAARAYFADDVRSGYFEVEPLADRHAIFAHDLIDQLSGHTLRTLDFLPLRSRTMPAPRCWRPPTGKWRAPPGRWGSVR